MSDRVLVKCPDWQTDDDLGSRKRNRKSPREAVPTRDRILHNTHYFKEKTVLITIKPCNLAGVYSPWNSGGCFSQSSGLISDRFSPLPDKWDCRKVGSKMGIFGNGERFRGVFITLFHHQDNIIPLSGRWILLPVNYVWAHISIGIPAGCIRVLTRKAGIRWTSHELYSLPGEAGNMGRDTEIFWPKGAVFLTAVI